MASGQGPSSPRSRFAPQRGEGCADAPDEQLLSRFVREGDGAAFAELVRRHGPMVWGVCRRVLPQVQDAEDAFQATFLVLACRARSLTRPERLAAWLYGVAHRTALKGRAGIARRRLHERRAAAVEVAPAEPAPCGDLWPVLDEELNRLPPKYRIPVVLYYLEGLTQEEIGRRLGRPRKTIATRLARACDRLRGRLTRRGVALSAAALATALTSDALRAEPPAALAEAAARNATEQITGRGMTAGTVPANVSTLARGVINEMWWKKLRTMAAWVLAAVLLAAGVSVGSYRAWADKPARDKDEKKAEKKDPIRQTAEQFLAAVLAGKVEEARALAEPDKISEKQVKLFTSDRMRVARLPLGIASIRADATQALVVTENVTVRNPKGPEEGPLLLTLDRTDKGWLVRDIDFGSTQKRTRAFEKAHPDAKDVP